MREKPKSGGGGEGWLEMQRGHDLHWMFASAVGTRFENIDRTRSTVSHQPVVGQHPDKRIH